MLNISSTYKEMEAKEKATGKLSITGDPCSPYLLTKSIVTNDGEVETNQVELHGRKIPLMNFAKKCSFNRKE